MKCVIVMHLYFTFTFLNLNSVKVSNIILKFENVKIYCISLD